MSDKRAEIAGAAQLIFAGSSSVYDDLAGPLFTDLMPVLDEAGFGNTDREYIRENFSPLSRTFYPSETKFYNSAVLGEIAIGAILYIGTSVGQWIISKLCDEVYEKVGGAEGMVGRLLGRLRRSDGVVTTVFDHWFDESGVLVRIECRLREGDPTDVVDALIPVALRRAGAWIEDHGITHRVVKYRIERGALADHPELSQPVAIPGSV